MFKHSKALFILLAAAVILTGTAAGSVTQTVDEQLKWDESFLTLIYAAAPTDDGYLFSVTNGETLYILKTDAEFKEQWRTNIDGQMTQGFVVADDGSSVFILVGENKKSLCRVGSDGTLLWDAYLYDKSFGISPIAISGKNVKIAGWMDGTNTGFTQSFLFENGYPANDEFKLKDKVPMAILADGNDYILVGGTISTERTAGSTAWIMKMTSGSKIIWETTIRENCDPENAASYGGGYGAVSYNLCKTSDGGYYVVGTQTPFSTDPSNIAGQIWGAKVTADGDVTWQKDLVGSVPVGVAELDGQYLIAGHGYGTAFSALVTPEGKVTRSDYVDMSAGMIYSLDASKQGKVVLGGCVNTGDGYGLFGKIAVYEDASAASSPLSAGIVLAGLLGAVAVVMCRRK